MATKTMPLECEEGQVSASQISELTDNLTKQHVELLDTQTQILQQLKILNTYLAMMNNTIIRSE